MKLGVTKEQTGPASWLVRPHGEVDLYIPALRAELFSVIYSGVGNVVVDLSRVFPIHDTVELALNANAGPAPTFS
jgi:hypothetical protein